MQNNCLMKASKKFFAAFFAMLFLAASAFAQEQPHRRASVNNSRQEAKVERQQSKVDKKQKPTNIDNQGATDKKVRDARASERENFGKLPEGFDNRRPSGDRPSGNRPNDDRPSGNRPSGNDRPSGMPDGNFGGGNRPPMPPSGGQGGGRPDFGNGNRPPMPPEGFGGEFGRRPSMAPVIEYSRKQIFERTNVSSIVVNSNFRTRQEAYDYIEWMLQEKGYVIGSYGNNYNWIQSDVAFIPTPFDWTNPMTHNQFRVKFVIGKSAGSIKVTITADWRESYLTDRFNRLRFQPSDKYSTYYAWNVLEDFANSIPHRVLYYK